MKKTAISEGRTEAKQSIVKNLLARKFTMEEICAIAECSEEFVRQVCEA